MTIELGADEDDYVTVECERTDEHGKLWQWRHVMRLRGIEDACDRMRGAIPGVVIRIRYDTAWSDE
jgi:hypothetical protein